jgi:hypothetical protein
MFINVGTMVSANMFITIFYLIFDNKSIGSHITRYRK